MNSPSTAAIFERLARVEGELTELRLALLKTHSAEVAKNRPGSLRGIWRGMVMNDEDFAQARASLFPEKRL
jgi:hypothetical protein